MNGVAAQLGIPGPGLAVIDDDGELLPVAQEIAAPVPRARRGARDRARQRGGAPRRRARRSASASRCSSPTRWRTWCGPKLSVAELVELADLGAWIELCALTCVGALATRPVSDLAGAADRVGPARCTLASDYGQAMNVAPVEGLQQFADLMAAEGLSADAIRTMVVANPATLVTR